MYFTSRSYAGSRLANILEERYRYEDCAVVALSDGGVLVGEQIAARLHCPLTMLLTKDIDIPGEGLSFGAVSQVGDFTYNSSFSDGEIHEFTSEFHGYLSDKKREAFNHLNRLLGDGGTIDRDLLRNRVIILADDGLDGGASLDVALDFLKPISIRRLVVAAPVASIAAVDKLHVQADELHILDVKENYIATNHYYDNNTLPSHEETIEHINQIVMRWS